MANTTRFEKARHFTPGVDRGIEMARRSGEIPDWVYTDRRVSISSLNVSFSDRRGTMWRWKRSFRVLATTSGRISVASRSSWPATRPARCMRSKTVARIAGSSSARLRGRAGPVHSPLIMELSSLSGALLSVPFAAA